MCKCVNPGCLCSSIKELPTPHVHAALIKAWADGAEIEILAKEYGLNGETGSCWQLCRNPEWAVFASYRIKPKKKPNIVLYAIAGAGKIDGKTPYSSHWSAHKTRYDNIKATFDGDNGSLKSVEMI